MEWALEIAETRLAEAEAAGAYAAAVCWADALDRVIAARNGKLFAAARRRGHD